MKAAMAPDGATSGMQFVGFDSKDGKPLFTPGGAAPSVDVQSAPQGEVPMAEGGLQPVGTAKTAKPPKNPPYVPPTPLPVSQTANTLNANAKIYSSAKPYNLKALDLETQSRYGVTKPALAKDYDPWAAPQFTSPTGNIQAASGKGWKSIPAWQNVPIIPANEAQANVVASWGPIEQELWSSVLGAQGETFENWLHKFKQSLPSSQAGLPSFLRDRGW